MIKFALILLTFFSILYSVTELNSPSWISRAPASLEEISCGRRFSDILDHSQVNLITSKVFFPKALFLLKERFRTYSKLSLAGLSSLGESTSLSAKLKVLDDQIKKLLEKEVKLLDTSPFEGVLLIGDKKFNQLESLLGSMNEGIFESEDGKAIVKVIKGLDSNSLREIYWALQVEELNGAKPLGVYRSKSGNIFLEMEKIFHNTEAVTVKDLRVGGDIGKTFSGKYIDDSFFDNFTDQLAARFKDTTEKGILPNDSDFMVNSTGDLKWLDVGLWNTVIVEEDIITQMDHYLEGMNKLPFPPNTSEIIFTKYFKLLENSKGTSKKKLSLLKSKYGTCPCNIFQIDKSF